MELGKGKSRQGRCFKRKKKKKLTARGFEMSNLVEFRNFCDSFCNLRRERIRSLSSFHVEDLLRHPDTCSLRRNYTISHKVYLQVRLWIPNVIYYEWKSSGRVVWQIAFLGTCVHSRYKLTRDESFFLGRSMSNRPGRATQGFRFRPSWVSLLLLCRN